MLTPTCSGLVDAARAAAVVELVRAVADAPYWKDQVLASPLVVSRPFSVAVVVVRLVAGPESAVGDPTNL